MLFKCKDISEYNILEKMKIDIDDVNRLYRIGLPASQSGPREYCELVAKDNRYNFYGYRTYSDGSGGYILRQEIKKQKKVVYFGKCKKYNIAFNGFLFQVNEHGEVGDYCITARNIEDGKLIEYDWLSEKAVFVSVNGFGRFNCQDQVKKVFIKDDKLIFKVSRIKSKDPYHEYQPDKYDINTQYDLVVEHKMGRFVATKVFSDEAASEDKQEKVSATKTAPDIQTDKGHSINTGRSDSTYQGNHIKKKYWMDNKGIVRCPGDACPEDCDLSCPIYVQTLALEKFTKDDYAGAAKLFQKAVDIEPAFADAWNNLAACYGQMGDDQKAYDAYKKSFSIVKKPNPLYGMAVATKNMENYNQAMQYISNYIDLFGNDDRIASLKTKIAGMIKAEHNTAKKLEEKKKDDTSSNKIAQNTGRAEEKELSLEQLYGKLELCLLDEDKRADAYSEMQKICIEYPEAGIDLGQYYQSTDPAKAKKYFKVAADAGIHEGEWGYSQLLPHSYVLNLSDSNDKEYLMYCLAAAEGGCPDAANEMGNICHRKGFYAESTYWYGMANALEHPSGMISLKGITKEWKQNGFSIEYKPHIDHYSNKRHDTSLLIYKMFNESLEKEDIEKLMKLAIVDSENLAGFVAGQLFEQSHHDDMAYTIYNALAFANHPHALRCYADMLLNGKGTARDVDGAFHMYQMAAEGGNAVAMFAMGQKAVKDGDKYLAACWFGQAYSRGMEMAGDWLEKLAGK